MKIVDLSTSYLGLTLNNPIVAPSSPLSHTVEGTRRLEDGGAGAVVLCSLVEEQIDHESHLPDHCRTYGAESFPEALSYCPDLSYYNVGPEDYLMLISRAKRAVAIPIIASLNGVSRGGWAEYAHKMGQAGGDALWLNVYYIPTVP